MSPVSPVFIWNFLVHVHGERVFAVREEPNVHAMSILYSASEMSWKERGHGGNFVLTSDERVSAAQTV